MNKTAPIHLAGDYVSPSQESSPPTLYSDLKKANTNKFYEKVDVCYTNIFSRIPYFNFIWSFYEPPVKPTDLVWQKILEKKLKDNAEDYKLSVRVRGIWNLKNVVDTFFFRWLNYQENMRLDDVDTKDQVTNEMVNVGILSALISTIWFAMLLQQVNDDILGRIYVVIWTIASISTLCSTVMCIFLLLAIHETRTPIEATYFIKLFDTISYGTGPHAPLILFYIGSISGVTGIYLYLFTFQTHFIAIISSAALSVIFLFFAITTSLMVSALQNARNVNDFVEYQNKKLVLQKSKF